MAQPQKLRVLLVTAGPTEWDLAGRLGGLADLPLTAAGLARARRDAEAQGRPWTSQIVSGSDQASRQVAEGFAQSSEGNPEIRVDGDLDEVRLGLWEGLKQGEAAEKFSTAFGQWREDPWAVSIPEGEELTDAQARIVEGLRRTVHRAKRQSGAVVVVLRPMAATLARLAMCESGESIRFWDAFQAAKAPLWVSLRRDFPWHVRQLA